MAAPSSTQGPPASSTSSSVPARNEHFRSVLGEAQGDAHMSDIPSTDETAVDRPSVRKLRSVSDAAHTPPSRASTPADLPRTGKDDISLGTSPATPQRTNSLLHDLSLQMPQKLSSTPTTGPTASGAPLSPKLDSSQTYGSPASVLPRRSRGLDFSRASTNLHHSTLAEASPDSSPLVSQRGVNIPQRKSTLNSTTLGSPSHTHSGQGHPERSVVSSSMSSINMELESSNSSDNDDDESMVAFDRGDPMTMTPQANRIGFSPNTTQSPGADWLNGYSAAKASLMNFQRARFRNVRSRHSSTSTSNNSSKPSPAPTSPPVLKSVETPTGGYFSKEAALDQIKSRRESLSLGARDLHLSDVSDDGEPKQTGISSPSSGSLAGGSNPENGRRGVVKRPVTRRGNLLPKSKNFARIRAALFEECTPVESEVKREAEVVRQVREGEPEVPPLSPPLPTAENSTVSDPLARGSPETVFGPEGPEPPRNTAFSHPLDSRYRTPPPPTSQVPESDLKDVFGGEITGSLQQGHDLSRSRASTPYNGTSQTEASDGPRKFNRKRRADDLDLASFKRRAVSPAMSVQSSPVLPQASSRDSFQVNQLPKTIIHPSPSNEGSVSNGGHSGHLKRVGMQGMNETNDGLMKMSID